jgi:hypothetical protein
VGRGPMPAETGSVATSPQAVSAKTTTPINRVIERGRTRLSAERECPVKSAPATAAR